MSIENGFHFYQSINYPYYVDYQVIARKYRPSRFDEVVGQEAIVTTLLNALKKKRLAHAYLFAGSQGTGKTTLARLLAKALNCSSSEANCEPCNACSSCKEISVGCSVDVLEIDGASHRGIEDVRQINETIGYAPTLGKYKIYLIDEVHMLTKEAFNALLKTLEEPPARVMFFFATTEPHKIPETILSRCQRFNLCRIPLNQIQEKLSSIAVDLNLQVTPEALHLIAERSNGSLRDAEMLFDQVIGLNQEISEEVVATTLGIMPREHLFALSEAGRTGDLKVAFELAATLFASGTSIPHFLEELLYHFRCILLLKAGALSTLPTLTRKKYDRLLPLYTEEHCLEIVEIIREGQGALKYALSHQIFLEMLLLRILRTHNKITLDSLVDRLTALEGKSSSNQPKSPPPPPPKEEDPRVKLREQGRHDTVLRFAAKELGGSLKLE